MNKERLKWIITGLDWDRLTKWEEDFVGSVEKYFKNHNDLTEKQEKILERIFKEKSK